jgi:hypothetical protein
MWASTATSHSCARLYDLQLTIQLRNYEVQQQLGVHDATTITAKIANGGTAECANVWNEVLEYVIALVLR